MVFNTKLNLQQAKNLALFALKPKNSSLNKNIFKLNNYTNIKSLSTFNNFRNDKSFFTNSSSKQVSKISIFQEDIHLNQNLIFRL
jgi:hypothetical protein